MTRSGGTSSTGTRLTRPAAVVFDCDGLLVDTEPSWEKAEAAMFTRRGLGYGPAQRTQFLGISSDAAAALMASLFGAEGQETALFEELISTVEVMIARADPMPGAAAVVAAVHQAGVPTAVASNSPRLIVDRALEAADLSGFAAIVTADDVDAPKPAPDLYRLACQRLGVAPTAAIAFEDSHTGLASASAAGLRVVGVPSLAGDFPADWVLESLTDPELLDCLARW